MEEGDSALLNKQSCLFWFLFLYLFFAQYIGSKESVCTFGLCGRRQGWDVSREQHRNSMLSIVKQITSPGWIHETSARAWCIGKTQRDWVEREVGGRIGMGNTCKSMADSCQCVTGPTAVLWGN